MSASFVTLSDGARLAVHTSGHGRDLVLVTGLGGTAAFWQPLAQILEPHFRITRFDQRGIGQSDRGTDDVDIARLASDTLAVLEHVDARNALVLGHSTGGVILQDLVLRKPERVAGLVLSGTWARPNRYMTELFRSRLQILHTAPEEYAAMGAFLGNPPDYLNANWATLENARKSAPKSPAQQKVVAERIAALLAFDRSSEIGSITLPTMIQGAEDDLIVPAFLQRELSGLMPRAQLAMLPSGGHFFPVSRSQECAEQLLTWSKSAL
jgi:aminoacrylate hydrolase